MIKRWVDAYNMEVLQHEAGHHIDFNIGFFPQRADVPRWLPEGLTMQFEVGPSQLGASFGKINYNRLNELRQQYGPQLQTLPMLRDFMLHQAVWFQGYNYPLGWALVYYLIKNYPEELPDFMQIVAQREDDRGVLVPLTEKLEQMEDLFGKIDEEWTQRFKDFISDIPMRQSELTPRLEDLP
jgi:virulence-associated protein VagC